MFKRICSFILALVIVCSFSVYTASAQQYVANVTESQWSIQQVICILLIGSLQRVGQGIGLVQQ